MGQWASFLPLTTCSGINVAQAAAIARCGGRIRQRKEEEEEQQGQKVGQEPAGNWMRGEFGEVRTEPQHRLRFPLHLTTLS